MTQPVKIKSMMVLSSQMQEQLQNSLPTLQTKIDPTSHVQYVEFLGENISVSSIRSFKVLHS
jgi:hypothetical protein